MPFVTKDPSKAIMKRSKLLKRKTIEKTKLGILYKKHTGYPSEEKVKPIIMQTSTRKKFPTISLFENNETFTSG